MTVASVLSVSPQVPERWVGGCRGAGGPQAAQSAGRGGSREEWVETPRPAPGRCQGHEGGRGMFAEGAVALELGWAEAPVSPGV